MSEQFQINGLLSALLRLNAINDRVTYTMSMEDGAALESVRRSIYQLQRLKKVCEKPSRESITQELDETVSDYFRLFEIMEANVTKLEDKPQARDIVLECLVEMTLGLRCIQIKNAPQNLAVRIEEFNKLAIELAQREFGKKR